MSSRVDSPLKVTKTITGRNDNIYSMCNLSDGRLVLGSHYIAILDKDTYEPQIIIENSERPRIIIKDSVSICGLKDGHLISSFNRDIIIYQIQKKDYKLIYKFENPWGGITKIIKLEDGRLCSCSDQAIGVCNKPIRKISRDYGGFTNIIEIKNYIWCL